MRRRIIPKEHLNRVVEPGHLKPGISLVERKGILATRRKRFLRHFDNHMGRVEPIPGAKVYSEGSKHNLYEFMDKAVPGAYADVKRARTIDRISNEMGLARDVTDKHLRLTPEQRKVFIKKIVESDLPIYEYTSRERYMEERSVPMERRRETKEWRSGMR